eukprot:scaffold6017_cov48-Phaeocystis_antarctica.AAC.3
MAPYVIMVEEAFESNSWTAFFRESVLVKVPGGCEGDEGGEGGEGGEDGGGGGEGGEGGEGGCEGGVGGAGGAGGGGGGKQSSQPAKLVLPSVIHWMGVPSGTTPSATATLNGKRRGRDWNLWRIGDCTSLVAGVACATVPRAPHAPPSWWVH